MAFVVPAIAAFAAAGGTVAAVGAALTGAAGFATFATVAGGFMASAGMLTKNKTLTKVGSILGLAGAVTGAAQSLFSSAGEAAAEGAVGSAADDALASSAGDKIAKDAVTESLKTEMANAPLGQSLGKVGEAAGEAAQTTGGAALTLEQPAGNLMEQYRAGLVDGSDYGTLARNGMAPTTIPSQTPAGGIVTDGSDYGLTARGINTASAVTDGRQASALAQAGQQIKDQNALQTVLDKIKGAGQWVKENPALAQVGGQALAGGMQAYQRGQEFDAQMNLLEQRRRRLNQPIVLGIQPMQLKTPGG